MILGMPKRALLIGAALIAVVFVFVLSPGEDAAAGSDESETDCRVTVTADMLNVRADPDIDSTVVDQLEQEAEVDAVDEVRDGYRKLDTDEWASEEFLEPLDDAEC